MSMGSTNALQPAILSRQDMLNRALELVDFRSVTQIGAASDEHTQLAAALQQVMDLVHQLEGQDIDRAIDAMVSFPTLDADQLEQVRRHAAERRELMSQLTFLPASEFANLIPQAFDDKSNRGRAVARWLQSHKLLGVRIKGDWHYPVIQLNTKTNEPFPELQPVTERARSQGYTDWEILGWLVRPNTPVDNTPGESRLPDSGTVTPQALVDAIKAKRGSFVSKTPVAPIALLDRGDVGQFQQRVDEWLGSSA